MRLVTDSNDDRFLFSVDRQLCLVTGEELDQELRDSVS